MRFDIYATHQNRRKLRAPLLLNATETEAEAREWIAAHAKPQGYRVEVRPRW